MSFGAWEGQTVAELRAERRRGLRRRRAARASTSSRRAGNRRARRWRASAAGRREIASSRRARRRGVAQGRDPRPAGAGHRLGHDRPAAAQARLALPAFLLGARATAASRVDRPRTCRSHEPRLLLRAASAGHRPSAPRRRAGARPGRRRLRRAAGLGRRAGRRPGAGRRALPSAAAAARADESAARVWPASTARRSTRPSSAARTKALLELLRAEAPDVLITEQFPFGRTQLRFELLPLLEAARALRPQAADRLARCATWCAASASPQRVDETIELLRVASISVLIHGDPTLVSFDAELCRLGRASRRAPSIPAMSRSAIWRSGHAERRRQGRGRRLGRRRRRRRAVARGRARGARPKTALADRTWRCCSGANMPARTARARRRGRHRHRAGAARLHDACCATPRSRSPRPATTPPSRPCAAPTAPCWCRSAPSARPSRRDRAQALAERGMVAVVPPGDAVGRKAWPLPSVGRSPARRSKASRRATSMAARRRRRYCIAWLVR